MLADKPPVSLLHQFKNILELGIIAARFNGRLLVTATSHVGVQGLDPCGGDAKMLEEFPQATSTSGIKGIIPDVSIVEVGNHSAVTYARVPGTFSV